MDNPDLPRAEQVALGQAKPAFDRAAALATLDGDEPFLRLLTQMFLEDASLMVAEIRTAIEQQDPVRLDRAAHKLKGATCPFFATAVVDSAQSLEAIGKSGQLATATAEFRRFEPQIDRLLTALTEFDAENPKSVDPYMVSRPEEVIPWTA